MTTKKNNNNKARLIVFVIIMIALLVSSISMLLILLFPEATAIIALCWVPAQVIVSITLLVLYDYPFRIISEWWKRRNSKKKRCNNILKIK